MKQLHGLDGLRELPPLAAGGAGVVLSVGNFDGMHRGHGRIIETAAELAREHNAALAVATFEPHPLTVLRPGHAPPRLTPAALKEALLETAGVDYLVVLPPAREVLDLTAEQFWQILRDDVRPAAMVEGLSFSFGKGRGGNIQRLREWTANSAVALHIVEPVTAVLTNLSVVPVSSSTIRWLLGHGRMRDAAICLGRPYLLEGTVVEGQGRGRTLGVPTANLQHADQLAPADGVYAARCAVAGKSYAVALSIGTNPTFADGRRQVEAHLIGFDGNLYGAILGIELVDWLRDQRKFPDVEALKRQIARDLNAVIVSASRQPQREIALAQI